MVYKFQCQCDADCIGRTLQSLEVQGKHHDLWELLRLTQNTTSESSQMKELAIGNHLADHYICRTNYLDDCFSVLYKARSKPHLAFLEAIAITLYCPTLCRQRRQFYIICLLEEMDSSLFCFCFSPPLWFNIWFKQFWCILLKMHLMKGSFPFVFLILIICYDSFLLPENFIYI